MLVGERELALELMSEDAEGDGVLVTPSLLGADALAERDFSFSLRIIIASLDLERRTVCVPSALFSVPGVDTLRPFRLGSGVCGSVA